jgi:hypothetical protein
VLCCHEARHMDVERRSTHEMPLQRISTRTSEPGKAGLSWSSAQKASGTRDGSRAREDACKSDQIVLNGGTGPYI